MHPVTRISLPGSFRVLHTSDLHLDRSFRHLGTAGQARSQDLLNTLEEIGDLALQHRVHLVLLAGDQFDRHNPETAVVSRFHAWLARLSEAGIRIAMIPGDHDSYWYEDSIYRQRIPGNTVMFRDPLCQEPEHLTIAGQEVRLYGIAHNNTHYQDVLPGFSRRGDGHIHIGIMHATVDPSPEMDESDRYLPVQSYDLKETGLDYIALGHNHQFRTFNEGSPGLAAYPGSPEPLTLDEVGQRSLVLLSFSGRTPEVTTIPCGRRVVRHEELHCTGLSPEQIVASIGEMADDAVLLRVELTGSPPSLVDNGALTDQLSDRFTYLSILDRTFPLDAEYVRQIEHEQTIRGQFVRRLRARIESADSVRERDSASRALKLGLAQLQKRSLE